MKQEQFEKWSVTRKKGMRHFILFYGLLCWGLPMFIIMTFIVNRVNFEDLSRVFVMLFIWAFAGIIYGFTLWIINEKKYQNHANFSNLR